MSIPMDIFVNFQDQIASFPFGRRDRWAERKQQENFGETVGGLYCILL